jgi:hypothetical protein
MSCARGQQKNKQTVSVPHEINLKAPDRDGTEMHSLGKIENLANCHTDEKVSSLKIYDFKMRSSYTEVNT